jgi:hypothetical protein
MKEAYGLGNSSIVSLIVSGFGSRDTASLLCAGSPGFQLTSQWVGSRHTGFEGVGVSF